MDKEMAKTPDAYDVIVLADLINEQARKLLRMLELSELTEMWHYLDRERVRKAMLEAVQITGEIQRGAVKYMDVKYAAINNQTELEIQKVIDRLSDKNRDIASST